MKKVSLRFRTFTPKQATKLLADSKDHLPNRPISKPHVGAYAHEYETGRWDPEACIIMLGRDPKTGMEFIVDGQHRLLAVIEHGKPVTFMVRENVPKSVFSKIDTGRSRKPRDPLVRDLGVSSAAASRIFGAGEILMEQRGEQNGPMTSGARGERVPDLYPDLPHLESKYGPLLLEIQRNTRASATTMLAVVYRWYDQENPALIEPALRRMAGKDERVEQTRPFRLSAQAYARMHNKSPHKNARQMKPLLIAYMEAAYHLVVKRDGRIKEVSGFIGYVNKKA